MGQNWQQVSEALFLVAQTFKCEWAVDIPLRDTLPSPALDAEIDGWCERLSHNLMEPLNPPDLVKPWILARLVSMSAIAAQLARQGDADCPGLSANSIRWFLVDEWHGALRDRWQMMMLHELPKTW